MTFEKSKELVEKNLGVSNIEDKDLLDRVIGDIFVEEHRKNIWKK